VIEHFKLNRPAMNWVRSGPGIPGKSLVWFTSMHLTAPKMLNGSSTSMQATSQAIIAREQKYEEIGAPVLAIVAIPHDMGFGNDAAAQKAFDVVDQASTGAGLFLEHRLRRVRV
jgi:hypothetical protein